MNSTKLRWSRAKIFPHRAKRADVRSEFAHACWQTSKSGGGGGRAVKIAVKHADTRVGLAAGRKHPDLVGFECRACSAQICFDRERSALIGGP